MSAAVISIHKTQLGIFFLKNDYSSLSANSQCFHDNYRSNNIVQFFSQERVGIDRQTDRRTDG